MGFATFLGAGSEKLGFSKQTVEEEDIALVQLSGMYLLNRPYSIYYLNVFFFGIISLIGMIIGSYQDGRTSVAFECAHLVLIVLNMLIQAAVHQYHHRTVDKLYRAINDGFYSYGDAMDRETIEEIENLKREKKQRKKMFGEIFKYQVIGALMSIIMKRIVLYAVFGYEETDGINGLIYLTPSGNWIPLAEYCWGPYLFGMYLSLNTVIFTAMTAISSVAIFIRFSEEFAHQLDIITLGLKHAIRRAECLFKTRFGQIYAEGTSDDFNHNFHRCLGECLNKTVEHHVMIIELFSDFKRMMQIPLFTVIFDGGALIFLATALCLSNESTSLKMTMPIFMTAELFYTYVYCGYGELLTEKFKSIGNSLYLDDWLAHSKILKPYFTIITAYTFFPKQLSAGGLAKPNIESFGSVIRTAYSFLNLLLNRRTR